MRRRSTIVAIAGALLALTGCRVDVTTSVELDDTGGGAITVDVVADADVLDRVPDLASQLRLDDLVASGWQTDGPVATEDGGLRVTLVHEVTGPDEADQVLAELNGPRGPYRDLHVTREVDDAAVTLSLTGALGVKSLAALADDDLQALVPEVPIASLLTDPDGSDTPIGDVFGARLVVGLPDADGDVTSVTVDEDGATDAQVFTMPTDGSTLDVSTRSVVDLAPRVRAPVIARIALAALVAWLAVSIAFAAYVIRHRRHSRP